MIQQLRRENMLQLDVAVLLIKIDLLPGQGKWHVQFLLEFFPIRHGGPHIDEAFHQHDNAGHFLVKKSFLDSKSSFGLLVIVSLPSCLTQPSQTRQNRLDQMDNRWKPHS
jgi:hypothetical protein